MIKSEFDSRPKINMAEELKLLRSENLDKVMDESEESEEMSVTDAFRKGQTAVDATPV
jgi:hypothetical protein